MKLDISESRKRIYSEIVKDAMGEKYVYEVEKIKREQCSVCKYKNKDSCRLNIKLGRCIKYEHKKVD